MGALPVLPAAARPQPRPAPAARPHWAQLLVLLLIALCADVKTSETNEYCRWETFNATCPPGTAILVRSARYGRMGRGRCLARDYYLGCAADVIMHVDARCSGRHECSIGVPDATLHEVQPCPKDIMAYLETGYDCVPVASGEGRPCQSYKPLVVSADSGYLASIVTEESGYGTAYCPWVIKVRPGQQVNVTLYDFSILTFSQDSPICQVYATIKERTRTRDVTVCGGSHRTRHLVLSDTDTLEVQMVSHAAQGARPYFFLHYQAVGCPTVAAPVGGWAERRGEALVVGCNGTTLKWHLVCKGSKWVGEIRNCTKGSHAWTLGHTWSDGGGFPYGLLISVAIGVILGIVLGTAMLAVVLVCRRRRHRRKEMKKQALLKPAPALPPGRPLAGSGDRTYPSTLEKNATLGKNGGYSHIWELRQSSLPNTALEHTDGGGGTLDPRSKRAVVTSEPDDYTTHARTVGGSSSVGHMGQYQHQQQAVRDHVYESPTPARRQDALYNVTVPYYHEFDPSDVEGNEIGSDLKYSGGETHSRNNNLRGTFTMGDE